MTRPDITQLKCPATGKAAYIDEERALRAIQTIWEKITDGRMEGKYDHMPRKAYRCPECGWWHISHGPDSRTPE